MHFKSEKTGFSLVEVVLALGVAVFSLLLLLAAIPTGMKVNRDSREDYQAAELLRQISFDLKDGSQSSGGSRFAIPRLYNAGGATDAAIYPEPQGSVYLTESFSPTNNAADRFYQLNWQVHTPSTIGLERAWLHLRLEWPVRTQSASTNTSTSETGFLLGDGL